jgi:hypothetical protein
MTPRLRPVLVALIALIATGILATAATAAPPVNETINVKDTDTFVDVIPTCENEVPYVITFDYNLVEHTTAFDDGREHGTFTQTGTFTAHSLVPGAGLDASGRVTIWGGFNDNGKTVNGTFTFELTGRYSDGTKIDYHFVDHFNARPDGAENFFSHCHD